MWGEMWVVKEKLPLLDAEITNQLTIVVPSGTAYMGADRTGQ